MKITKNIGMLFACGLLDHRRPLGFGLNLGQPFSALHHRARRRDIYLVGK